MTTSKAPLVFISYAWEGVEHARWVFHLAEKLVAGGCFVALDQWDVRPGDDLVQFMSNGVASADFVLVVCTRVYLARSTANAGGVGFERSVIGGQMFYQLGATNKFIPLLREGTPATAIPPYLASRRYVDFRHEHQNSRALELLLRTLHDEVGPRRPSIGLKPTFSTDARDPDARDFCILDLQIPEAANVLVEPRKFWLLANETRIAGTDEAPYGKCSFKGQCATGVQELSLQYSEKVRYNMFPGKGASSGSSWSAIGTSDGITLDLKKGIYHIVARRKFKYTAWYRIFDDPEHVSFYLSNTPSFEPY
jgi:TIR domain